MAVTYVSDHTAQMLQRLLSQYQGQQNITALFTALGGQIQAIEDGLFGLINGRMLFGGGAIGEQLDNIGTLPGIGIARNGLSDDQFRTLILGQIAQSNGDGTLSSLLGIVQGLFEASQVFVQTPNSPCHAKRQAPSWALYSVGSPTLPAQLFSLVENLVQASQAAGVMLAAVCSHDAQGAFAFAGPQPWVGGFADVSDVSQGAPFATLLWQNPSA